MAVTQADKSGGTGVCCSTDEQSSLSESHEPDGIRNPEAAVEGGAPVVPELKQVTIRLGYSEPLRGDLRAIEEGTILRLNTLAEEPVDLLVDGRLIARGDLVVVDDKYCIRIVEQPG